MKEIRVALIEDHDLTRVGIRTALQQREEITVVGEAANGNEGLKLLLATKPDIAIVDIGLPDMDGIELTRQLKASIGEDRQGPKVLILTLQDNQEAVLAAFAAGADSYCMKDISFDNLLEALRVTQEGNSWIDPAIARIVLKQTRQAATAATSPSSSGIEAANSKTVAIAATEPEYSQMLEAYPLTDRELEVLQLIVEGHSNAAIADKLYITVGTVKTHVRNILNKLCADDRTQAAVRALRSGLVG
ncbi:response regulator [Argonema galeatum]|uniref:response regulator n=1 Tax=Argonema galeatum TaxID=2942762 RepID=UPI002012F543|nr:response regulator transcription factor [Argonema galeatum]MCL1464217.1 response regulator transcription factor [Argonema galeatum A003/A1]